MGRDRARVARLREGAAVLRYLNIRLSNSKSSFRGLEIGVVKEWTELQNNRRTLP